MSSEICSCHQNHFTHWDFLTLSGKYDFGIKAYLHSVGCAEPYLTLYISIWQITDDVSEYKGKIAINLFRSSWAGRKGISAAEATDQLQAADNDLNSEPAQILINLAKVEVRSRLQSFESSGNLDLSEISA